jgi:hypothetical protein
MAALDILALDTATPQVRVPSASDTYRLPRATAIAAGTLNAAGSALNLSYTANSAGQLINGVTVDMTDTASNSASLLMNLRVGGNTRFSVSKMAAGRSVTFDEFGQLRVDTTGGGLQWNCNGGFDLGYSSGDFTVPATWGIRWRSGSSMGAAVDLSVFRDAANTLALRNGTAAQTFRTYGTFTDSSNGRWLEQSMTTAGVAVLRATGNGTGGSGNVLHISSLPTSNPGPGILWNNAGTPAIGT